MYIKFYLNEEEYKWVKKQKAGFVRSLIQEEMKRKGKVEENPEGIVVLTPPIIKKDSLFACKKCGHILVANKCINKNCK